MLKPGKYWANQNGSSPYHSPDPWPAPSCSSSILLIALLQQLLQSNQTWQLPKTYFSSWGWSNFFFYMEKNKAQEGREGICSGWKQNWVYWFPRSLKKFYWHLVALQSCVSFYCTAKWITFNQLYIYISPLFWIRKSHLGYHQALSSLCHTVGSR